MTSPIRNGVLAVLVGAAHQAASATLQCIDRWGVRSLIETDVVINEGGALDYFTFIEQVRARHPGKVLILAHADVYFDARFFEQLAGEVAELEAAGVPWGVLGPAGVTYPYFRIARNMVDFHGILSPSAKTLPAIHLDGHLLVVHPDLDLDFDPDFRGFHHYDTALCMASWEQGRPAFVINLPLRHLGEGNVEEWAGASETFAARVAGRYRNKAVLTTMGPVPLPADGTGTRDFYKDVVAPAMAEVFGAAPRKPLVIVVRVGSDRGHGDLRTTLLSVAAQFEKPHQVVVLHRADDAERVRETVREFEPFVDILLVEGRSDAGGHPGAGSHAGDDLFFGRSEAVADLLRPGQLASVVDDCTVLFPNYVSDQRDFATYVFGASDAVAAFDFNFAMENAGVPACLAERVSGRRTETVEDIAAGNFLPLFALGIPSELLIKRLRERGTACPLSHDALVFLLVADAKVVFLRRLGGYVRSDSEAESAKEADPFLDVGMLSEFFRTRFPYGYIYMQHRRYDALSARLSDELAAHEETRRVIDESGDPAAVGLLKDLRKELQAIHDSPEFRIAKKVKKYPKVMNGVLSAYAMRDRWRRKFKEWRGRSG